MLLAGPIGTSKSSRLRLKYPKTRLNVPSEFCSQPSYTGTMVSPLSTTCARVREPTRPASTATAKTPLARESRESVDRSVAMFMLRRLLLLRRGSRTRQLAVPAQRATQHGLSLGQVQLLAPLRHLLLELFIGQGDGSPDIDHHVVDRTVPQPRPVPRVDDVLVCRRVVEVAGDTQDRSLRQQRCPVFRVRIDPDPPVVISRTTERLSSRAPN